MKEVRCGSPAHRASFTLVVAGEGVLVVNEVLDVFDEGFAKSLRIDRSQCGLIHALNCSLKAAMFSSMVAFASLNSVLQVEVAVEASWLQDGIELLIMGIESTLVCPVKLSR